MTWSTVGRFDLMMLATLVISFFAMFCWCRRESFAENQTPRYLISRLLVAGVITLLFIPIIIKSDCCCSVLGSSVDCWRLGLTLRTSDLSPLISISFNLKKPLDILIVCCKDDLEPASHAVSSKKASAAILSEMLR